MSNVESIVVDFVGKVYGASPDELSIDTMIKGLSTSSIKVIGLSSMLEEKFDVSITLAESNAAKTSVILLNSLNRSHLNARQQTPMMMGYR
jgi:acyl carrier protein